jgi:hypothetical protein
MLTAGAVLAFITFAAPAIPGRSERSAPSKPSTAGVNAHPHDYAPAASHHVDVVSPQTGGINAQSPSPHPPVELHTNRPRPDGIDPSGGHVGADVYGPDGQRRVQVWNDLDCGNNGNLFPTSTQDRIEREHNGSSARRSVLLIL